MVEIKEKREKIEFVVVKYICNSCGETCEGKACYPCDPDPGLHTLVWGRENSIHLVDDIYYKFDICEKCLLQLFNNFKIPPDIEDHRTGDDGRLWDEKRTETYKELHGE